MKNSNIVATLIILQILAQAVFAQQELQQVVPQEPQQAVQQEFQPAVQQVPQQVAQAGAATSNEQEPDFPANTITIDFGPTIIGFAIGALPTGNEVELSGFGFAAQYERQIFKQLSVAGRFAYLGSDIDYKDKEDNAEAGIGLSSFSLEAHPRTYPFGGSFFLDGMLGYADMSIELKGDVNTDDGKKHISSSFSRGYFKYGAKLGWRADFGKPGGFIFEHSYGWYSG